ncbi:sensor histidine kinase [Cohnella sp. REN36]|uniref:cache domain-containing sensor histidine kinase n=1 Tax=Cohnella sp. REN36 TaxID=2887347 RepID=UPI001D13F198|nr:sensor histidine kinase [Cohnella sp. REN36]MCC3372118.1 histidine kinase [Cohnella sp. REN36]
MKRVKDWSIRQKLFSTYVLLIVVPLGIINFVSYTLFMSSFENRIVNSFKDLNQQIISNSDTFLKNMLKISEKPYYDQQLVDILAKDYSIMEYEMFERSQAYRYVNDTFFKDLLMFNDDIDSLVIYPQMGNYVYRRGYEVIFNYDYSPDHEAWYKRIIDRGGAPVVIGLHTEKQVSSPAKNVVSIGRVIVDSNSYRKLGVFVINLKSDALSSLYKGLKFSSDVEQVIVDENDTVLFSTKKSEIGNSFDSVLMRYDPKLSAAAQGTGGGTGDYYIVSDSSAVSGWKFYSIIHKGSLFSEANQIRRLTLYTLIPLTVTAFFAAYILSRRISTPILSLSRKMQRVELGEFDVTAASDSRDEIGHLGRAFNKMTREIKSLIGQIKDEEYKKRNAELNALQNQINPHFMYNTLTMVKWMSQAQRADNITEVLDALIRILTFSTRNTEEYVTIEEEMTFIRYYMQLLQLRYYHAFEFECRISDEVLSYRTLKFIVQPFVENSVFHGFIEESRQYKLTIDVERVNNAILFTIRDDGVGMEKERMQQLRHHVEEGSEKINSIGISNVFKRIQMHFGSDYGVDIYSEWKSGTTVVIRVPVIASERSLTE